MLINSRGKINKNKKNGKNYLILLFKDLEYFIFLFFNVFGKKFFTKAALILLRIHV